MCVCSCLGQCSGMTPERWYRRALALQSVSSRIGGTVRALLFKGFMPARRLGVALDDQHRDHRQRGSEDHRLEPRRRLDAARLVLLPQPSLSSPRATFLSYAELQLALAAFASVAAGAQPRKPRRAGVACKEPSCHPRKSGRSATKRSSARSTFTSQTSKNELTTRVSCCRSFASASKRAAWSRSRSTELTFEVVRENPLRFLVVSGHEQPDVESVIERHSGYLIVEKHST